MAGMAAIAPLVGAAGSAAGGIMGGMGAQQAANAQANALDYQAQEDRRAGLQDDAVQEQKADQQTRDLTRTLSNQRAQLGGSGGGIGGSAYQIQMDTAKKGIFGSDVTLWEGAEQKDQEEDKARLAEMEADSLRSSGQTQAMSGVISGVSGVFSGLSGASKSGGFGASFGNVAGPSGGYYYGMNGSSIYG